jgi:parvulin-like peptidyl-prolyl isomerase
MSRQFPDALLVLLSDLLERGFDPLVVLSVLQVLIHGFQAFGLFGDDHHQVVNQIVYREVLVCARAFLIHKRIGPSCD